MKRNQMTTKLSIATAIAILLIFSLPALAEDAKNSPAATPASRGSDKVDLKKLEDKYWSSKDDDYGVIQNRTFTKTGKFYGSLVYGPLVNDSFAKARASGLMIGYYLSEDFGVEASYLSYASKQNDTVSAYETQFGGVKPDYNLIKANKSLSITYTPFYAKMAFMNKAILYFDMGFTLGIGTTDYEIQKVLQNNLSVDIQANETKSAPHFEIGVMQQLFISQFFAFRVDIKNTFYNQKIQQYKATNPQVESSRTETTKSINDTTITFGLTVFTK
ncbi:MAG: outer membrane beta-barrel domain-containing protein [Pseudobdellovibrio sp.]